MAASLPDSWRKRRVFLDTDSVTRWDHHVMQRFPVAEKVPVFGLEPGSTGPWDAAYNMGIGTVMIEDGLFRMWYQGLRVPETHREGCDLPFACYAESEDGIHWRKPDLKITGQHRFPGNNLLTLPGALTSVVRALPGTEARYLACTIILGPLEPDVQDVPGNPDPRPGGYGTHIWASDDGFHWRHVTRVLQHGDIANLYADAATQRYLLYHKVGGMHGLTPRRMWIGLESRDGTQWDGYDGIRQWRETFVCDDYDDQIAQARGFLLAETFNTAIYRAGETLMSAETIYNAAPPLREIFGQNPAGTCHIRLGFSHDGYKWRHPKGRPVWLERGIPGELDSGCLLASSTFVEHGDDLLFYYGGMRYDHDWCMNPDFSLNTAIPLSEHHGQVYGMLAKTRRDRFASLAAVWKGYVDIDADHRMDEALFVNAQATHGAIRVALAEKTDPFHGSLRKHDNLPGFSFEDCIPITGDQVRAPVRFKKARVADIPPDTPLTIRFELAQAEVFGYEWSGIEP